jgi:hypothetical protein
MPASPDGSWNVYSHKRSITALGNLDRAIRTLAAPDEERAFDPQRGRTSTTHDHDTRPRQHDNDTPHHGSQTATDKA